MKSKVLCLILVIMMALVISPYSSFAVELSDGVVILEDEELSDEEAFELYNQEDVEQADEDDLDDEGEEETLEDEILDIEGEGAELGIPGDDDFIDAEDMDTECMAEDDSDMNLEEPDDDGDTLDGYEEIVLDESGETDEDVSKSDNDDDKNVSSEDSDEELGSLINSIKVDSSIVVGYKRTDSLDVNFTNEVEKLYIKVQDPSVCSVTKGKAFGKKAVLNVTGKKAGKTTYVTIKTKLFGLITLQKKSVRVNVPAIYTSPSAELNVVKGGLKQIKISYANAKGLGIQPAYSSNAKKLFNSKWSKWKGKSVCLNVTGKKNGSAYVSFKFYDPKSRKMYGSKSVRINVRGAPSISASQKKVALIAGKQTRIKIATNGLYGENAKLIPRSTNKKAFSATWSERTKSSGVLNITAKKKGKGTLYLYLKSNSTGNQLAKASLSVRVSQPSLSVSSDTVNVETGKISKVICTASGMSGAYRFGCYNNTPSKCNASVGNRKNNKETLAIKGVNAGVGKVTVYIKKGSQKYASKVISVNVKPASKPTIKVDNQLKISVGDTVSVKAALNNMPMGKLGCSTEIISGSSIFSCSQPTKNTPPSITVKGKKTGSGAFVIRVFNNGKQIAQKSVVVQVKAASLIKSISYNFSNFTTKPSKKVCENMFVGEHAKTVYKTIKKEKDWGNCFGMSTTAGLFYSNNGITPSKFNSSALFARNLSFNGKGKYGKFTLKEWIQAMMISQYSSITLPGKVADCHSRCSIGNLVNQVKADLRQGNNTEIEVFHIEKGNTYGHSVLGIGFENVNSSTDRILIYDSNYQLETKYINLKKNASGSYTGWSYGNNYSNKKGYIGYTSYNGYKALWDNHGKLKEWNDVINKGILDEVLMSDSLETEDEEMLSFFMNNNFVSVNSEDFTVLDVDDNVIATIEDGQLKSTNNEGVHVLMNTSDEENDDESTFMFLPVGVYKYRNNDVSIDHFNVNCANLELSVSVESESDVISVVADDNEDLATAVFKPEEGIDYSVSLGSSKEGEPEEMEWSGVGTGEPVSVALEKGDLSVCNTDNANLAVTADNEEENDLFTITASVDGCGEITPEGATPVWKGEDLEYLITPDAGYKIADVQIDDESVGVIDRYVFKRIKENHRISVEFERDNMVNYDISQALVSGVNNKVFKGKAYKQKPLVKYKGVVLDLGEDYSISYINNVKVGTSTIIIKGKGIYTGTKRIKYRINPNGTHIKKITKGKKKMTIKWGKQAKQTSGYQIQYSLNKNFKSGNKIVAVKNVATTKRVISNLKSGKTYSVRVRTYKKIGSKFFYSRWSTVKSIKVR